MTTKATAAADLAEALRLCTGSVAVTVTDGPVTATATAIKWNEGSSNGTCLAAWLDLPKGQLVEAAVAKLEAAAGAKGDWEYDDETGWNWWGLHGTFGGAIFTVYTHKSGTLKIGATHNGFLGGGEATLNIEALKTALLALVAA